MAHFFNRIMNWLGDLKGRLFVTMEKPGEREPLSKFSIVIILLLDAFLFGLVYTGISEQVQVIESPEQYASYECRNLLSEIPKIHETQTRAAVIEDFYRLSDIGSKTANGYYSSNYELQDLSDDRAPECLKMGALITQLNDDASLKQVYATWNAIQLDLQKNANETATIRASYDTKLLEKIAGQDTDIDQIKTNLAKLEDQRKQLESQKEASNAAVYSNPNIQEIVRLADTNGASVMAEYKSKEFWFPAKTLGVETLFLLPLLLVVGFWSNRSLQKGRWYQLLIASHLLTILGIFVVIKLMTFVYDIIPRVFIENLINWLVSIKLVGIWYYFIILLSVLAGLALVYFIQRRIKTAAENRKAEVAAKRAEKGECWFCSAKLLPDASHCIRCGSEQLVKCKSCKELTPKAAEFCRNCGKEISE